MDGLWTMRDRSAPDRKLVDKPPSQALAAAGYISSCSKGRQTASGGTGVYIGTDNYGPAVPSGVFMSRAARAVIAHPDLEPAAIRAAHERIDPVFTGTPQYVHEGLSARLGVPVVVKVETVNPIRSFKGRGTWVAMAALAGEGSVGPGPGRRVRVRRQLRPGRRVRGARPGRAGRRVLLDPGEPREGRPHAGARRHGDRGRRRLR